MGKGVPGKGKHSSGGSWGHIAGEGSAKAEGQVEKGLCDMLRDGGFVQWGWTVKCFWSEKMCQINMLEESLESVWRRSHTEAGQFRGWLGSCGKNDKVLHKDRSREEGTEWKDPQEQEDL